MPLHGPKSALGQFEQEFTDHGYRTFVLRHGNDAIPADADTVLVANSTMLVTHRDQLRDLAAGAGRARRGERLQDGASGPYQGRLWR